MSKLGASPLEIPNGVREEKVKSRVERIQAMQEAYAEEVQEAYDDICVWLATPDEDANTEDTILINQNLILKAMRVLLKGNLPMPIPDEVADSDIDQATVVDVEGGDA